MSKPRFWQPAADTQADADPRLRAPSAQRNRDAILAVLAGVLLATRGRQRARLQWPALAGVLLVVVALAVVKYAIVDTSFADAVIRFS